MEDTQNLVDEEFIKSSIDLTALVGKTSKEFITDRETHIQSLVKVMFHRQNGLLLDIERLERDLKKKQEALKNIQEKIMKIRSGDWSVLKKIEEEEKNHQGKKPEADPAA
jgi:hypothetical protein